jgi:hypothetical protein
MSQGSRTFIHLAALAGLAALLSIVLRNASRDDAFIYLQVARNLVEGGGWSFNPGDGSNPCTGPLYVVVLALLLAAGIPGETALVTSFSVFLVAAARFAYLAFEGIDRTFAVAAGIVVLTSSVILGSCGVETALYMAVIFGAIRAYQKQSFVLLGVALGALPFIRPDGVLVIAAFVVVAGRELCRRRDVLMPFALTAAGTTAAVLLATPGIVPNSVLVKMVQGKADWNNITFLQYFF